MKKLFTPPCKKLVFIYQLLFLFVPYYLYGQIPSPIEMIFDPRENTFALSGIGGGNLGENFVLNNSSIGGQIAIDMNFNLENKKYYQSKLKTFTGILRYNPFVQSKYDSGATMNMRKLAFTDNESQFILGVRYSTVKESQGNSSSKTLKTIFADLSSTQHTIIKIIDTMNSGFRNFNVNTGVQFGFLSDNGIGLASFTFNAYASYIYIYENNIHGNSFEELTQSSQKLSKNILGGGARISVTFNSLCFFLDAKRYTPIGNSTNIRGLTERALFSFGATATGVAFSKTRTGKNLK